MEKPIVTNVETLSFDDQMVTIESDELLVYMHIKNSEHFFDKDEFIGKEFPGLVSETDSSAALNDEIKSLTDAGAEKDVKIQGLETDLQKANADLLAAQNEVDQLKAKLAEPVAAPAQG